MVQINASKKKQMEIIRMQQRKLHIMRVVYDGQRKFIESQRKVIQNYQLSSEGKDTVPLTKQ